jgi:hypothetical protein
MMELDEEERLFLDGKTKGIISGKIVDVRDKHEIREERNDLIERFTPISRNLIKRPNIGSIKIPKGDLLNFPKREVLGKIGAIRKIKRGNIT